MYIVGLRRGEDVQERRGEDVQECRGEDVQGRFKSTRGRCNDAAHCSSARTNNLLHLHFQIVTFSNFHIYFISTSAH